MKQWFDKVSGKCYKLVSVSAGKEFEMSCSLVAYAQDLNWQDPLTYLGKETITVPLGTFTAKKYKIKYLTLWLVEDIPLPVKTLVEETGKEKLRNETDKLFSPATLKIPA